MSLRVGIIGTGSIGTDHANTLARNIGRAEVAAVFDVDLDRALEVAASIEAKVGASAESLIVDDSIDAIVIASSPATHASLVMACIREGKPVMCEKPLATSAAEALQLMAAEDAHGTPLVQVGFMRRFDPGYQQVKRAIDDDSIGTPLLMHCVHRNPTVPDWFTSDMGFTDSMVHEIDVARWLLDDEVAAVRVMLPKPSPRAAPGHFDPQLAVLTMASGPLVEIEVLLNSGFGYDVRCEVVGSDGIANLENPRLTTLIGPGRREESVPDSWKTRFGDTYRLELQAWVDATLDGHFVGPTSWDGYAATAVAHAAISARKSGELVPVLLADRPALYR